MTVKSLNFWDVLAKNQRWGLSSNNYLVKKMAKIAKTSFFYRCFQTPIFCFFGLATARNLIFDGGLIQFLHQLEYKCEQYGSQLRIVDRFYLNFQPSLKNTQLINCGISNTKK